VLGNEWAARELLLLGASLTVTSFNGRTPLFVAAEKGMSEFIYAAFRCRNIDINTPVLYPYLLRPLHVAACHKQAHVVSLLLDLGANVNVADEENGYTPLTMAIIGGCIPSALSLIARGTRLDLPSQNGRFPM
jgi:ankyrin repeat protein